MNGVSKRYSATIPFNVPDDYSVAGWSGSISGFFNEIPSSWWNDFLYPFFKLQISLKGGDLTALTGSRWINHNGHPALTFQMTIDDIPIGDIVAAVSIATAAALAVADAAIASFNAPLAVIATFVVAALIASLGTPVVTEISPVAVNLVFVAAGLAVIGIGGLLTYEYFTNEKKREQINRGASSAARMAYAGAQKAVETAKRWSS